MLYHCDIFLSSSLITEPRVLCRYRRKETLNQINLKVYFSRPFQILIFASYDKWTFQFDQTYLRKWDAWSHFVFLSVQVHLDVSASWTSWLTSYKFPLSKWPGKKSGATAGKAAAQLPCFFQTQEDLPRNRLGNVFNTGKVSAGSENQPPTHKSIKFILL